VPSLAGSLMAEAVEDEEEAAEEAVDEEKGPVEAE
jgi:hypothetical protein